MPSITPAAQARVNKWFGNPGIPEHFAAPTPEDLASVASSHTRYTIAEVFEQKTSVKEPLVKTSTNFDEQNPHLNIEQRNTKRRRDQPMPLMATIGSQIAGVDGISQGAPRPPPPIHYMPKAAGQSAVDDEDDSSVVSACTAMTMSQVGLVAW